MFQLKKNNPKNLNQKRNHNSFLNSQSSEQILNSPNLLPNTDVYSSIKFISLKEIQVNKLIFICFVLIILLQLGFVSVILLNRQINIKIADQEHKAVYLKNALAQEIYVYSELQRTIEKQNTISSLEGVTPKFDSKVNQLFSYLTFDYSPQRVEFKYSDSGYIATFDIKTSDFLSISLLIKNLIDNEVASEVVLSSVTGNLSEGTYSSNLEVRFK